MIIILLLCCYYHYLLVSLLYGYYYYITIVTIIIYIQSFIIFACIDTFPPGQKLHVRVFFSSMPGSRHPLGKCCRFRQVSRCFTFWEFVTVCELETMTNKEIVDLPNLKMAIFHSYVSLPEGKGVMDGFGSDLTIANGDLIFFQKE